MKTYKRGVCRLHQYRSLHLQPDFVSRALNPPQSAHNAQPVVQLLDPSRPSVLDGWIQEDDLVLYPDFVYNGLDDHMVFHEL